MAQFSKVVEGYEIFKKYGLQDEELSSHEDNSCLAIYIEVNVSKEDREKLTDIGWYNDEGTELWFIN